MAKAANGGTLTVCGDRIQFHSTADKRQHRAKPYWKQFGGCNDYSITEVGFERNSRFRSAQRKKTTNKDVMYIKIGSIYQTNQCGDVVILETKRDKALVRFKNTGTQKWYRIYWIERGCIRDPYARLLCGVACVGNVRTKGKNRPYYSVWHDMINRCYNVNDKRHKAYLNVSVSDDWLTFESFLNDCKTLDGFDEKLFESGIITLDKDIKQRFMPVKVYSRETCVWVDKRINSSIQDSQQKPFYAKSPDGEIHTSSNITQFARIYSLNRKNISAVLNGRGRTVHGWRFSYEEIA